MIEQEGFLQRFRMVASRIGEGGISRNQAARELNIGSATIKRLMVAEKDAYSQLSQPKPEERLVLVCT